MPSKKSRLNASMSFMSLQGDLSIEEQIHLGEMAKNGHQDAALSVSRLWLARVECGFRADFA